MGSKSVRPEQILTVYRKELLETLRDRRTLIIMVVVPILLYPLIALLGVQAMVFLATKIQEQELVLGLVGEDLPLTHRIIAEGEKVLS